MSNIFENKSLTGLLMMMKHTIKLQEPQVLESATDNSSYTFMPNQEGGVDIYKDDANKPLASLDKDMNIVAKDLNDFSRQRDNLKRFVNDMRDFEPEQSFMDKYKNEVQHTDMNKTLLEALDNARTGKESKFILSFKGEKEEVSIEPNKEGGVDIFAKGYKDGKMPIMSFDENQNLLPQSEFKTLDEFFEKANKSEKFEEADSRKTHNQNIKDYIQTKEDKEFYGKLDEVIKFDNVETMDFKDDSLVMARNEQNGVDIYYSNSTNGMSKPIASFDENKNLVSINDENALNHVFDRLNLNGPYMQINDFKKENETNTPGVADTIQQAIDTTIGMLNGHQNR